MSSDPPRSIGGGASKPSVGQPDEVCLEWQQSNLHPCKRSAPGEWPSASRFVRRRLLRHGRDRPAFRQLSPQVITELGPARSASWSEYLLYGSNHWRSP